LSAECVYYRTENLHEKDRENSGDCKADWESRIDKIKKKSIITGLVGSGQASVLIFFKKMSKYRLVLGLKTVFLGPERAL